jgi:hypothetical protein
MSQNTHLPLPCPFPAPTPHLACCGWLQRSYTAPSPWPSDLTRCVRAAAACNQWNGRSSAPSKNGRGSVFRSPRCCRVLSSSIGFLFPPASHEIGRRSAIRWQQSPFESRAGVQRACRCPLPDQSSRRVHASRILPEPLDPGLRAPLLHTPGCPCGWSPPQVPCSVPRRHFT